MKSGSSGATQAPAFQIRLLSDPSVLQLLPFQLLESVVRAWIWLQGFLERRIGSPIFMHKVSPLVPNRATLAGCGQAFGSIAWLLLGLRSFGCTCNQVSLEQLEQSSGCLDLDLQKGRANSQRKPTIKGQSSFPRNPG